METFELFKRLGLALAVGVLIGIERGWREQIQEQGEGFAGLRTFALIGLLGGIWATIAQALARSPESASGAYVALGLVFAAFAGGVVAVRLRVASTTGDFGMTTVIAAFTTFGLGCLAVIGDLQITAAAAVAVVAVLGFKEPLHKWLAKIERAEIFAGLKLLVMTLVLLPLLPNRDLGPWQALNPYELWLMVVLIAGVSFVGYVGAKIAGEQRGLQYSAAAGALASSTAVTLDIARRAREAADNLGLYSACLGIASAVMLARILAVASIIEQRLFVPMAAPFGMAILATIAFVAISRRRNGGTAATAAALAKNPLDLWSAVKFGLLLAGLMLLTKAALSIAGASGLYALAAISGLADTDAITLSLAKTAGADIGIRQATIAISLAAAANTVAKLVAATIIAGRQGLRICVVPASVVILALVAGVAALLLIPVSMLSAV